MPSSNTPNKKLTRFLIWGPLLGLCGSLILFAIITATTGGANNDIIYMKALYILLGLTGFLSIIGLVILTPMGLYRLAKEKFSPEKIKTQFIPNTEFSDPEKLSSIIIIVSIIQAIILAGMAILIGLLLYVEANPGSLPASWEIFIANFNFEQSDNFLIFITLLNIILLIFWTRKIYKNLYAFNIHTKNTPNWVVAQFFFPVINLFEPYKNLREIWEHTLAKSHTILLVWWILSIVSSSIESIGAKILEKSETAELIHLGVWISIGSWVLTIVALILQCIVVSQLSHAQIEKHLHPQQRSS